MSATTERPGMPSEDEVRRLVRSVVDAMGADGGRAAGIGTSAAGTAGAPSVGAQAGPVGGPSPTPTRGVAPATPGLLADPPAVSIAIGGDHGGVAMKDALAKWLSEKGHPVTDCGTHGTDAVDYPDIALAVARLVADGTCTYGIVIDGAGIGSCMAANKVPGIRAALCHDISTARNSREHNHANVLTLGARLIGEGLAMEIVTTWLSTAWGPGRHAARVEKIAAIERTFARPAAEGRTA